MEVTKTTLAVIGAASLAVGAGMTYVLTRGGPTTDAARFAAFDTHVAAYAQPDSGYAGPAVDPAAAAPAASRSGVPTPAVSPQATTSPAVARPAARLAGPGTDGAPPARRARPEAGRRAAPPEASPPVPPEEVPAIAVPVLTEAPRPYFDPAPPPFFEELVVSADTVIGLQVETPVSSERAQIEDQVVAQITRDVHVGDRVAIPAGSRAFGEVTLVERGGKVRERARLGVRFTSVLLGDGTRVPIETAAVIREGSSPGDESAAKIGGGAIGGAIIGGILGGARGAAIGGATGAGAGTAAVFAGGRNAATLPAGTPITVRLLQPAAVMVEE